MTIQNIIDNADLISTYIDNPKNNNVVAIYMFKSGDYSIKMSLIVEYDPNHETIDIINTQYNISPNIDGFDNAMCALGGRLMNHIDIDEIFDKFE